MTVFRYDKSWEGLLTAIFDAYARRTFPDVLLGPEDPQPMFADQIHSVTSDPARVERVWNGIRKKADRRLCNMLINVWLSEQPGSDMLIMRYVRKLIDTPHAIAMNFADPDVLAVHKLAMQVSREGEHVRQFIRFQKAADGSYFAPIAPKFNALPLAIDYLRDRFADQKWLVYDTRRHYGYYYDLTSVTEVTMDEDAHLRDGNLDESIMDRDEKLFQQMWRSYFKAVTIKERINPKLQRQHMPRRFWKYLTESRYHDTETIAK